MRLKSSIRINSFKFILFTIGFTLVALLTACGGGGAGGSNNLGVANPNTTNVAGLFECPPGNAIFSIPPVALANVVGWEPLGHLSPPSHTFPTDHQYLYVANPSLNGSLPQTRPSYPLIAPANIRVVMIASSTNSTSGTTDYSIYFQTCADVAGQFGHVGTLAGPLAALVSTISQHCNIYEPAPGFPVMQCQSGNLSIDISAGTQIGTVGDGGSLALDWWLQDRRVLPLHFANAPRFSVRPDSFDIAHTVGASDYFIPSMASQIAAKMGRFDGAMKRTFLPLGGSIAVDVDATARGYWFKNGQPYPPESSHAALVPDYVTPDSVQVFSLGISQANVGSRLQTFAPISSGSVNRAFETVTADGNTYCYEFNSNLFFGNAANIILVQLVNSTTLRIEVSPQFTRCTAATPYNFSVNAVTYQR